MTQILSDDRAVRSLLKAPGRSVPAHPGPGCSCPGPSPSLRPSVARSGSAVSTRREQQASPSGLADDGSGESPFEGEVCKLHRTAAFSTATWQNSSQGGETREQKFGNLSSDAVEPATSV